MELTGRVCEVARDYITKKPMIKFLINEEPHGVEAFDGKDLKITVKKITKPRSLNANAYFHVLCDKLRHSRTQDGDPWTMAHMKNYLVTSYGEILYMDDGVPLVYKTNAYPEFIEEQEEPHMKFIKKGDDGAYWYRVYRGVRTYDSMEMHRLLEGTIQECKMQGIETLTPNELKQLEIHYAEAREWEPYRKKGAWV